MESSGELDLLQTLARRLNEIEPTCARAALDAPPWSHAILRAEAEGVVLTASFDRKVLSALLLRKDAPHLVALGDGPREVAAERLAARYGLELGIMWSTDTRWLDPLVDTWRRTVAEIRSGGDPLAAALRDEKAKINARPKYEGEWDEAAFRESVRRKRDSRPDDERQPPPS